MNDQRPLSILTLNAGSSSLKAALFEVKERERLVLSGEIDNIGVQGGRFRANAPVISSDTSRVTVRVIKTDEEAMIARHTRNLIRGGRH